MGHFYFKYVADNGTKHTASFDDMNREEIMEVMNVFHTFLLGLTFTRSSIEKYLNVATIECELTNKAIRSSDE